MLKLGCFLAIVFAARLSHAHEHLRPDDVGFTRVVISATATTATAPTEAMSATPADTQATDFKPLVALAMAGPPNHCHGNIPAASFAKQMKDHVIAPLLDTFKVAVFVTCEPDETALWEAFLSDLGSGLLATRVSATYSGLPPIEQTRWRADLCHDAKMCTAYWLQYGHLRGTQLLIEDYEREQGVKFNYIMKARNDVFYPDDAFFNPKWLLMLPDSSIAVNSVEFHTSDRWVDRKWAPMISDQFMFGWRDPMDKILNISNSDYPCDNSHIETILKEFVEVLHIEPKVVEWQLSQPGCNKFVNGNPKNGWVQGECKRCWSP